MPEAIAEGKTLRFATEEDRLNAMYELPEDPPVDVKDVEDWHAEQTKQLEAIENAEIGEGTVEGSTTEEYQAKPDDETVVDKKPEKEYNSEDWILKKEDIPDDSEFTFTNAKDMAKDIVNSERYIKTLKKEGAQAAEQAKQREDDLRADFEKKLADARTTT